MHPNGSLAWFNSVRSYYEAGAASAFILHLNVHDPPGNALSLADFLRRAFSDSHLVIEFDRARGLFFASADDERAFKAGCGFKVDPIAAAMGKSVDDVPLPTSPDQALALVGGFTERLTCLIVHNAGLVCPDADVGMLQPADRTTCQVLLNLAKREGHAVFLLTSNLAELHTYVRSSSSGFLPITIPYPDEEARTNFIEALVLSELEDEGYTARAGRLSSGLTKRQILQLYQRFIPGLPSDDEFAATKRKLMEDEFGGVLTPLNPDYGFEAVGGLFNVKRFFAECVIEPIRAGQYSRVPMGVLMMGPAGCLHPDTPIYDPLVGESLSVRDRWLRGRGFHVWAMSMFGPVIAPAEPPIYYEREQMIRLTCEDGGEITVTPEHRLWDGSQWVTASSVAERLRASEYVLLASSSGLVPCVRSEDALRSTNTEQGCQGSCSPDPCPCGGLPLPCSAGDRSPPPSPAGVREHSRAGLHRDGRGEAREYSHACPSYDRPSTHRSALRGSRTNDAACGCGQEIVLRDGDCPSPLPRFGRPTCQRDTSCGLPGLASASILEDHPSNVASQFVRLVSAHEVAPAVYYDFHVPHYENYAACGTWHHNTGKTCTAIAVAKEAGINAVTLDLSKIFGKYVGESEKNLEKALYAIVSLSPCLVFIDEIDQTVQRGGDGGDSGVSQRVFRRLLEFMSDTSHRGRVIFLAATNRPDLLDAALKRPGRMDQKLVFPIPDGEQRASIFEVMLNKYAPDRWHVDSKLVKRKAIITQTEGFTGAEIETVVIKANELALRDSAEFVTADHVLQALKLTRRTTQSVEFMTAIALVEVNDLEFLPEGYADTLDWAKEYVERNKT